MKNTQLPRSTGAEKGILSSMMLSPRAIAKAVELLTESNFHHPAHRELWSLIVGMWSEKKAVDLLTVTQAAEDSGILETIGGAAFITDVYSFVPCAANWREYAEIVREKALARRAISVANQILEAAYDPASDQTIAETVQTGLVEIAGFSESKAETKPIAEILARRLDYFENLATRGNGLEGLPTGIAPLDRAIRGLRPGNVVVLAAVTKGGKTSLALNLASNAALAGYPVGIFSLEMNEGELADRLIAANAGIDLSPAAESGLSVSATGRVLKSIRTLSKTKIFVRDESAMTPLQFRAAAQSLVAQHGVKLLVLDYLQLMTPSGRSENREQQVAEASRTVKTTASELGIPVIVLCQLNESGRSRESRAIEQDCNIFAVIEETEKGHCLNIKLARDCDRARIPMTFRREFTRFEEVQP